MTNPRRAWIMVPASLLSFLAFLALVASHPAGVGASDSLPPSAFHLVMGLPAPAKADLANKDNYLLREPYFAISYNDSKGTPNWVSWHLSTDYVGNAPRRNRFTVDGLLPDECKHVVHNDYTKSGFQRGHMCPHSDRAANKDMSYATFVMTNVVPQSSACNEGSWESLEAYCRYLVTEKGKDLFIVAGPIGKGGEGENPTTRERTKAETITDGKVTVPEKLFKVVLVVENPEDVADPKKWVDDDARLIAVIMPNNMEVAWDKWQDYRTTVKAVEDATGFDFFPAVKNKLLEKKSQKDTERVPKLPKAHGRERPE